MKIKFTSVIILLVFSQFAFSQSFPITGKWLNEEKDAIITIKKEMNGSYSGFITWMKFPNNEYGNPKKDPLNPNEKLRNRNRLGMKIMYDFIYDTEDIWINGRIYDPKSGKTYRGTMTMSSENRLDLRGYVGITWFGRTSYWTRKN